MKETKKSIFYLESIAKTFEIIIALMLLVIVAIRVGEVVLSLFGFQLTILFLEFEKVLSIMLNLVIGVELTKMLIKHTPETVVDVLLFAIARQMVVYHERTLDLLIGVVAIAGLFAIKKYLSGVNCKESSKGDTD
jgi:hypothetical protein